MKTRTPGPARIGPPIDWPASSRSSVATVTPVIGLLAETAACGSFTESEAGAIRKLAAVDAATRADVLADATEFLTSPKVPLDEPTRRRLFDRLALFGLKVACDAAESGTDTASGLVAVLQETSGFAALMATIERRLLARAGLLTAHVALAELRRLSYGGATGPNARALGALRDPLERVELDSELHRLRLLDCLSQVYRGDLRLPQELADALQRFALGTTPEERLGLEAGADRRHRPGHDGVLPVGLCEQRRPTEPGRAVRCTCRSHRARAARQ